MNEPRPFTLEEMDVLRRWDTPTICNGLELVAPERRTVGFTTKNMVTADRSLPPIVGLARVGTMRSKEPPRGVVADRADWYDYVADANLPTIVVLQDLDDEPGYGAMWGEVHTAVHLALGARGCVTNGSFRDTEALAKGFQIVAGLVAPSHAHNHFVDFGRPVNVLGMNVGHDDVVHADHHGAVVVPAEAVRKLPAAIDLLTRRERVVLDLCASSSFTPEKLREALKASREIH